MRIKLPQLSTVFLLSAMALSASGQSSASEPGQFSQQAPQPIQEQSQSSLSVPVSGAQQNTVTITSAPTAQQLLDFKDSDVKFDLRNLMEILRDRRHEGWVLAAYPDPKTSRPLIGAGFSLDLPEREHPQHDPLNPRPFLEPSSAQLWQAAGLDMERLQTILQQYNNRLETWSRKRYRTKIRELTPQITSQEATSLLRISVVQAIYNAKAYCRNFDSLTASQQMALSQLVYQMGVNLEEFEQFLSLLNSDSGTASPVANAAGADPEHWKAVQQSLIQSQWARLYRARAVSVIAMLNPQYLEDPRAAELQVSAVLHPAVTHRRRSRSTVTLRSAAYSRHAGKPVRRKTSSAQAKPRA